MEALFERLAAYAALFLEATAIIIVVVGAAGALAGLVSAGLKTRIYVQTGSRRTQAGLRRAVWLGFAGWLLLGLEFALAADIVRTAISPSWDDLGQLAVIAAVRTFLNYFLERDIRDAVTTEA